MINDTINLGYTPLAPNYGFYLDRAPQQVLDELKPEINKLQKDFDKGDKLNSELVGEIEHEYRIPMLPQLKDHIKYLCQMLENSSKYMANNFNPNTSLKTDSLWINFQKKYEYNPVHWHEGIFSFVIWYQIPYYFEDERKFSYSQKGENCKHGKFEFVVPQVFNKSNNLKMYALNTDKKSEGTIAIFPSDLSHVVWPFYSSDEYRITVAGNVTV